jgi:hypothetical protein
MLLLNGSVGIVNGIATSVPGSDIQIVFAMLGSTTDVVTLFHGVPSFVGPVLPAGCETFRAKPSNVSRVLIAVVARSTF